MVLRKAKNIDMQQIYTEKITFIDMLGPDWTFNGRSVCFPDSMGLHGVSQEAPLPENIEKLNSYESIS